MEGRGGSESAQKEKLNCEADPRGASADSRESSGARMALQCCENWNEIPGLYIIQ